MGGSGYSGDPLYSNHRQETDRSYIWLVERCRGEKEEFSVLKGYFHRLVQFAKYVFTVGCDLKEKLRQGFSRRRLEFCLVWFYRNSGILGKGY